jgi:hypothetical protein
VGGEPLIVIIDLEKDRLTIDLKRPKVVFLVRVTRVAEIIVHGDGFNDACDGLSAESGDTGGDEGGTDRKVWRSSSLSARICSVLLIMIVSWGMSWCAREPAVRWDRGKPVGQGS